MANEPFDATAQMLGQQSPFDAALDDTISSLGQQRQQFAEGLKQGDGPLEWLGDTVNSAGLGVGKAIVEATRTGANLFGQDFNPIEVPVISDIYKDSDMLRRKGGANGIVEGVSSFATGMVGAGKLLEALKIAQLGLKGGLAARGGIEIVKGAMVGATVFDPYQARLSNLIQDVPALRNPINGYLAATGEEESVWEGRLKNALEGAGMDLALAGTFGLAIKAYKKVAAFGRGEATEQEVTEAVNQLQEAQLLAQQPNVIDQGLAQKGGTSDAVIAEEIAREGAPPVGTGSGDGIIPPQSRTGLSQPPNIIDMANTRGEGRAPSSVDDYGIKVPEHLPQPKKTAAAPEAPPAAPATPEAPAVPGAPEAAPVVQKRRAAQAAKAGTTPDNIAVVETVGEMLKDTGRLKGKISTSKVAEIAKAIEDAPPGTPINGTNFRVIPGEAMAKIAKMYGGDGASWRAAANRRTGEILISENMLKLPPAEQAEIISHELGHTLEDQFYRRVAQVAGTDARSQMASLRKQMVAASKALRPKNWDVVGKRLAANPKDKVAKLHAQYLNSHNELFADTFALWKTRRQEFGQLAPDVARLFDEHFEPWIDTDLTTIAPHTARNVKAGIAGQQLTTVGTKAEVQTVKKGAADQVAAGGRPIRQLPETYDVDGLWRGFEADTAALNKWGSRAEAISQGHRFASANLPWQQMEKASGAYKPFMDRAAEQFKAQLDTMKMGDVLHDPQVQTMVGQRVKLFNEDPAELLGELAAAGANANGLVANMKAALALAQRAGNDLFQQMQDIKLGNYAKYGGTEETAKASIGPRLALYVQLLGEAQSMRAATGRAMRQLRGEFAITPEQLAKIRTMDPDQLAKLVDLSEGDPTRMAKMATRGFWDRAQRAAGTLFANNLLWNYKTHISNLVGNSFMMGVTPAMRAVGSFAVMGAKGTEVRTIALREYRYMVSSWADAWQFARDAYLRGDSIIDPHQAETWRALMATSDPGTGPTLAQAIGLRKVTTAGDILHNGIKSITFALTQPVRTLGMVDEFVKQTSYRASVLAKASLEADRLGLEGQNYKDFIQKTLDGAFDDSGRYLDADAMYDAQTRTFSQPLLANTMGKGFAAFVGQHPMLRLVVPFVRTPINLFRYSHKMLPGLNLFQKEYRQMLKGELGANRQADAYGQMVMGIGLATLASNMVFDGRITGAAPSDPGKRKALQDTGWQPYSFVSRNPDGSATYTPYNRLDPVGMTLGIFADLTEVGLNFVNGEANTEELALAALSATIKNLGDKTYLQSISAFMDAASDPETSLPKLAGNITAGLIPMSSALRNYNPDPVLRETRGYMDTVLAGLPGFSTTVPPQRDAFGDVKERRNVMWSTNDPNDIVNLEQERMLTEAGVGVTAPTAQPKAGVDLREYRLQSGQTAFDRYQELSQRPVDNMPTMKEALAKLILSDKYKLLPDGDGGTEGTRLWALNKIVRKYRDAALKVLYKENPDLHKATTERQAAAREAYRENLLKQQLTNDNTNVAAGQAFTQLSNALGLGR